MSRKVFKNLGGNSEIFQIRIFKEADMRKNLKEARKAAGMTQQQVADLIGITLSHYQMIEQGDRHLVNVFVHYE